MKILINSCYGGYGLSEDFVSHINKLTEGQLVNTQELYDRANPLIVEEAIKFGLDKASGTSADLTVQEIPDNCHYSVHEYDGMEYIDAIWIEATLEELKAGLSDSQLDLVTQGCQVRLKNSQDLA